MWSRDFSPGCSAPHAGTEVPAPHRKFRLHIGSSGSTQEVPALHGWSCRALRLGLSGAELAEHRAAVSRVAVCAVAELLRDREGGPLHLPGDCRERVGVDLVGAAGHAHRGDDAAVPVPDGRADAAARRFPPPRRPSRSRGRASARVPASGARARRSCSRCGAAGRARRSGDRPPRRAGTRRGTCRGSCSGRPRACRPRSRRDATPGRSTFATTATSSRSRTARCAVMPVSAASVAQQRGGLAPAARRRRGSCSAMCTSFSRSCSGPVASSRCR